MIMCLIQIHVMDVAECTKPTHGVCPPRRKGVGPQKWVGTAGFPGYTYLGVSAAGHLKTQMGTKTQMDAAPEQLVSQAPLLGKLLGWNLISGQVSWMEPVFWVRFMHATQYPPINNPLRAQVNITKTQGQV